MPMQKHELEEIKRDLEKALSLPEGLLDRLLLEDDWSFVIKCHALVEATLTHLLSRVLDTRLAEPVAKLNIGGRSGKLAFVEALGLLDEKQRRFVQKLSELRNSLVHDVARVNFTFTEHVKTLTTEQRVEFVKFSSYFAEYQNDPKVREKYLAGGLEYAQFNIWWGLLGLLLHSHRHMITADVARSQQALEAKVAEGLRSFQSSEGAI